MVRPCFYTVCLGDKYFIFKIEKQIAAGEKVLVFLGL